jgi:GNAT superfamily N-acetyltransferase
VANCAGFYRTWAERTGRPTYLDANVSVADLGVAIGSVANNATVLRPLAPADLQVTLAGCRSLFAAGPGGGWELWSLWPLPRDVVGVAGYAVPCMVRPAGGSATPPPAGVRVEEATSEELLRGANGLIDAVLVGGRAGRTLLTPEVLADDFRVWVALVDGEAVATASAYVGDGFCGVYAVATHPAHRGRGYGEAVSWAATLARPDLEATLQASPMGRPVYERMGYRTIAEFAVWEQGR